MLEKNDKKYFILPGPPREIKSIWETYFEKQFSDNSPNNMELIIWKLMGISESLLAQKIEPLIDSSTITSGYRPHVPYIELKLWIEKDNKEKEQNNLDKIKKLVEPWYISEGDFDPYLSFISTMKQDKLLIVDKASNGLIQNNFRPHLNSTEHSIIGEVVFDKDSYIDYTKLEISPLSDDSSWTVSLNDIKYELELPFKYKNLKAEIKERYISEMSILKIIGLI